MVVSQNFSSATSLAMFAPISTLMVISSFSWITSEMSLSPSGPSSTPWGNKSTTCWCLDQTPLNKLGNILEIKGVKSMSSNKKNNLDEWYSQCIVLYLPFYGVTYFPHKLVRDHKHQNVCIVGRLHQVRHCQLRRDDDMSLKPEATYCRVGTCCIQKTHSLLQLLNLL